MGPEGARHEEQEAPGSDSCADDPRAHAGLHRLDQRSDRAGSAPDFLIARRSIYAGTTSVKPAGAGPSERGSNPGGPGIGPS